MKTPRFAFIVFACIGSMFRAAYADKTTADNKKYQGTGHAAAKVQKAHPEGRAKANVPKPIPKRQAHLASPAPMNRSRSSSASFSAEKGAAIQSATAKRSRPVRQSVPARASVPLLSNVRHHSPNPAIIAGSIDGSKRNTVGIDARQVHRQP